jgi:hypothetical protein
MTKYQPTFSLRKIRKERKGFKNFHKNISWPKIYLKIVPEKEKKRGRGVKKLQQNFLLKTLNF